MRSDMHKKIYCNICDNEIHIEEDKVYKLKHLDNGVVSDVNIYAIDCPKCGKQIILHEWKK